MCCSKFIKKLNLYYFLCGRGGILAAVMPAFPSADALPTHLLVGTAALFGCAAPVHK